MKIYNKIVICIVLCYGGVNKAQQLPFYCHYYINSMLYNPSMTGYGYQSSLYLQHRSQYGANYMGAPITNTATFETSIKNRTVGLGGMIFNDRVGLLDRTGIYLNYAYKLQIDKRNRFLFGVSGGLFNSKIKFDKAVYIDENDPLLLLNTQSVIVPDINIGATYMYKATEIGVSFPQLLGAKAKYNEKSKNVSFKTTRNFYASIKHSIVINKTKQIKFVPLLLLKGNSGKIQYDINAIIDSPKLGWAGVSYKSGYAAGLSIGTRINDFLLGYQYEIPTTKIAKNMGINHEILLGLKFGKKEVIKKAIPSSKY